MGNRWLTTEERFDRDYVPEPNSGCWIWVGSHLGPHSYGHICINYRTTLAHRYAYERFIGPIPPGLVVRHRCDTKSCVNPAHLVAGTQADNIADKVAKNRQAKGQRHGMAKLTDEQAQAIARLTGSVHPIAAEYGIHWSRVYQLRKRAVA